MSGDHYLHHVSTIIHLPGYLESRGIDPVPVFRNAGIPILALLEPDGWFTRENALAVANAAERLTGDQFLGVRQATRYRLEHLGAWGQTILASPDLRSALRFGCTSLSMLQQGARLQTETKGQKVRLTYEFAGRMGAPPRQHIEAALLVLSNIVRLSGVSDIALGFGREKPQNISGLEEFFGPDLSLGNRLDYLEFDRSALDVPIGRAIDPGIAGHLDTVRLIQTSIRSLLPYERPTIESLAPRLGTSVRTLQRRLRDFGVSFEGMLDNIRHDHALNLLQNERLSVTEVAFVLGYSDIAHFTRAFKRWVGLTPTRFRAILREGQIENHIVRWPDNE